MSRAEIATQTAERYVLSWRYQPPTRLVEELTSFQNETHRKDDRYRFLVEDNDLKDPGTGRSIFEFFGRNNPLELAEYQVAADLSRWANSSEDGVAFWMSPELPGIYPCSKLIISQITHTPESQKSLLNTAIVFDASPNDCANLTWELGIKSSWQLRSTLFTTFNGDHRLETLVNQIRTFIPNSGNIEASNLGAIVSLIKSGASEDVVVQEMQRAGLIGKYSTSCPPSFSIYMTINSKITLGTSKEILCCKCPLCDQEVMAEIYDGEIHCPNCKEKRPYRKAA